MEHPDTVLIVDGNAGHLPERPVFREVLGPKSIDHVTRHTVLPGSGSGEEQHRGD